MKPTTILAIVAIVAALGAVTSLVPLQHVSATPAATNQPHHPCSNGEKNGITGQIPGQGPPFCA